MRFLCTHPYLGFAFGGLGLTKSGFPLPPWIWRALPVQMEFLLLDRMAQTGGVCGFLESASLHSYPP